MGFEPVACSSCPAGPSSVSLPGRGCLPHVAPERLQGGPWTDELKSDFPLTLNQLNSTERREADGSPGQDYSPTVILGYRPV